METIDQKANADDWLIQETTLVVDPQFCPKCSSKSLDLTVQNMQDVQICRKCGYKQIFNNVKQ